MGKVSTSTANTSLVFDFVIAENAEDLGIMLNHLSTVSAPQLVGLRMNVDKTKVVSNAHVIPVPVLVGNMILEVGLRPGCVTGDDLWQGNVVGTTLPFPTMHHNQV